MQDWFGGIKWFVELARKDKVLALITVLVVTIVATVFVSYKVFTRSEAKEDSQNAADARRQFVCDSIALVKDAQIAQLNLEKLELIKEFNEDLKEQRDRFQGVKDEKVELTSELKTNNKRISRKLRVLNKEFVEKNGN